MKIWVFNCREVSKEVSASMDRELSWGRKMGIGLHLMMCRHCARFRQQLRQIRDLLRSQSEMPLVPMDKQVKEKIKKILGSQGSSHG